MGKLTEKMRDWLHGLACYGPAKRPPKSPIGYKAQTLGYTEWDCRDPVSGAPISTQQAMRYEALGIKTNPEWKERITDAGRLALAEQEGNG